MQKRKNILVVYLGTIKSTQNFTQVHNQTVASAVTWLVSPKMWASFWVQIKILTVDMTAIFYCGQTFHNAVPYTEIFCLKARRCFYQACSVQMLCLVQQIQGQERSYSTLYDSVCTTSKEESPMPVFLKLGSHMIQCKYNTCLINLFSLTTATVDSIVMVPSTLSRGSLWCVQCWIVSVDFFLSTTRKFQHVLIQYCIKCIYRVHIYLVTLLCTVILKSYMSCFHPVSANIIQLTMCTLTHIFMLWQPVQEDIIANISAAICCIQPLKQTLSINKGREIDWLIEKKSNEHKSGCNVCVF